MSLWRKFLNTLPRPSLLWMSYNDVLRVRNQLASLCFPRGDYLDIPIAGDLRAELYPALISAFKFNIQGRNISIWLKIVNGVPKWDVQAEGCQVDTVPFNSRLGLGELIKNWSKKFPFKPHPGSLTHQGEFLA